jgi:hydroxymethylpyrimidine pyrophosphatase-like HAD family hydrolase
MKPLDAIPEEVWSTVVGVATDLDDTLTHEGNLSVTSLAALGELRAMGVPCVIATGRPLGWAAVVASIAPVRAAVAENGGAWVVREERGVRVAFRDPEPSRHEGIERCQAMVERLTREFPELRRVEEYAARVTDVTLDIGEKVNVARSVVEAALARVREARLYGVASSIHLHVSAHAPDKMTGLRLALEDLGLDAAQLDTRWIYLGDSPNDAWPFAKMQLSVGVRGVERFADVSPAMPKYITTGGAGEGIAEVVARLRHARGSSR